MRGNVRQCPVMPGDPKFQKHFKFFDITGHFVSTFSDTTDIF